MIREPGDKGADRAFASTVTVSGRRCSSCLGEDTRIFYEVEAVPTQQVTLMRTREEALACPRGDLRLAVCNACGFIWNSAFDPALLDYQGDYEATQAHSPTFNAFHERLAEDMIERYGLRGRDVIEIGCGHGEFVAILCEKGVGRAIGFDPVILDATPPHPNARLVAEFYTEADEHLGPDFVFFKDGDGAYSGPASLPHHAAPRHRRSCGNHRLRDDAEWRPRAVDPRVLGHLLRALRLFHAGRSRSGLSWRKFRPDRSTHRLWRAICSDRRQADDRRRTGKKRAAMRSRRCSRRRRRSSRRSTWCRRSKRRCRPISRNGVPGSNGGLSMDGASFFGAAARRRWRS